MNKPFIALSGLIGAGKSTLTNQLSKELSIPAYYESVIDNKYLSDFYRDMKKYAFQFQIYLLSQRFEQQQNLVWSKNGGIQDRSIYEDLIFAKMLCRSEMIDKRDFDTYKNLLTNMSNFMRRPDIIIYLDVSPKTSLERIKQRNRVCESSISIDYLKKLRDGYEEFIQDISSKIPVIRVEWNKYMDVKELAVKIMNTYKTINNIHNLII